MSYQTRTNVEEHSVQEIENESFNDAYKIKTTAPYGYDSVSDSFKPNQVDVAWDYIAPTYNSTSDVYVYKTGGSGGTTVATTTVNYTDSTKSTISSIVRS